MNALNQLLDSLKMQANVNHNGQYCGAWAVDISGTRRMSFHVVTKGKCYFEFEGQTLALEQGDAVFMPSDIAHCVSSTPNTNVEINAALALPMTDNSDPLATGLVCGNFVHNHPVFEKLISQMPQLIVIRADDDGAARQIIELILQESRATEQHSSVLLNRLADCLFYLLVRHHLDVDTGVFAAMAHPNLSRALDFIHQQDHSRISLDELAAEAAMSRSAFASLFKDMVGQTPMEYLTQWRMTQAYRWLADDGITTFEAATRCGYESESSFSKAFKRVMGVGPGLARSKPMEMAGSA